MGSFCYAVNFLSYENLDIVLKVFHYFLLRDKSVCELGGGMTCVAGIAVSSWF